MTRRGLVPAVRKTGAPYWLDPIWRLAYTLLAVVDAHPWFLDYRRIAKTCVDACVSLPGWIAPSDERLSAPKGTPLRGTPARVPAVTCAARFASSPLLRDPDSDRSELRVVWLQRAFALPIDPAMLKRIKALDWEGCAHSWRW